MNEYWQYRIASWISRYLPRNLAYWIGLRIADVFYSKNGPDRKAITSNLNHIFENSGVLVSDDMLEGTVRKTFQYFGKYLVDFFRFYRVSERDVKRLVSSENISHLEDAYQAGKGVIIVTAHFGNWELGGAVLAALGYPLSAVFLPHHLRKLEALLRNRREGRGVHPIPLGHAAVGSMRCLRKGECVALLADRDFSERNDRIPFFGSDARLPRGPAWLAIRSGAPIVPTFLVREVDDTFRLRCYPAIWPNNSSEIDVRLKIRDILQREISRNPHQWFVFDDFWS